MHCGGSLSELQGALVFHRMGKRVGHQMYMVVFVEECSMCIFSSWVYCTQFIVWVSLISGVGYRVEQWGGKWDAWNDGCIANSCNWRCCLRLC